MILTDYGALPLEQRNILRLIFTRPEIRSAQIDWETMARFVVASFRADAARAGASAEIDQLAAELCAVSPEFERMWRDNDVQVHGEGTKRLAHPQLGTIELEFSGFAVDGRPDLGMIVYNPATKRDVERLRVLLERLA